MYEVTRPLSNNLKGGYHINYPFGYVGRRRVCVVTYGLNLPRHGTEKAYINMGRDLVFQLRTSYRRKWSSTSADCTRYILE